MNALGFLRKHGAILLLVVECFCPGAHFLVLTNLATDQWPWPVVSIELSVWWHHTFYWFLGRKGLASHQGCWLLEVDRVFLFPFSESFTSGASEEHSWHTRGRVKIRYVFILPLSVPSALLWWHSTWSVLRWSSLTPGHFPGWELQSDLAACARVEASRWPYPIR